MQEVETHAFKNVAPRAEAIVARSRKGGQCLIDPTLCHVSPAVLSEFSDQPSEVAVPCQEEMAAVSDDRMAGPPTGARADGADRGWRAPGPDHSSQSVTPLRSDCPANSRSATVACRKVSPKATCDFAAETTARAIRWRSA